MSYAPPFTLYTDAPPFLTAEDLIIVAADLRRDQFTGLGHTSGYVFGLGDEGAPPTAARVSVTFARWMRLLGLSGVSHHVCRHRGASNMLRDGASSRAVQLIGGWTSLRMVERYCHVTDEELHKAVSLASAHTAGTAESAGSEKAANG